MRRILSFFIFTAVMLLNVSCSNNEDYVLLTIEDVEDQHIALQQAALSDNDFSVRFPNAKYSQFESTSELLLSLSIGKYDAAVVSDEFAENVMEQTNEFALLDEGRFAKDSIRVIVHKSRIPGRNIENYTHGSFVNRSFFRVKTSLISEQYIKLILRGLLITITIFIGAWILAIMIAIIMTLLKSIQSFKLLWKPVTIFIQAIHDVPSVVLIFFFYYIVFAHSDTDGLIACIAALGVYGSGSFTTIINTHLDKIDPMQHKAAHMLGLKGWKKYHLVILPQAVKSMLPFFISESKVLLRATTFAGYVSILDIVKVSELIRSQTYDTLVPLLFVSIVFLILSWLIREGLWQFYKKMYAND